MANTRSDIITNLDTRLKTILTAGGYQSNIGSKVYNYVTYDISDSDLPCIVYRDPEIIPLTAIQSQIVTCDYLLNVEIMAMYNASTAIANIRKAIEDIKKAIGTDPTFTAKAINTYHSPENNDIITVDQGERKIAYGIVKIQIHYRTQIWQS